MKRRETKLTIVLFFIMTAALLLIPGCTDKNPGGTGDDGPHGGNGAALDLIGGSLEYACEQNTLSNLLSLADNVKLTYEDSEGNKSCDLFFKYGDNGKQTGRICTYTGEDGTEETIVNMACMIICEEGGRIEAEFSTLQYESEGDFSFEDVVTREIYQNGIVQTIEDLGDSIKVTATYSDDFEFPDEEYGYMDQYLLEKNTLSLLEHKLMRTDGTIISTIKVEYDADTKGLADKYLKDWQKTRHITFNYEKIKEDGKTENKTLTISAPATWEVLPLYESETFCFLDAGLTIPYKYPGDGKDYTIYVTNAVG